MPIRIFKKKPHRPAPEVDDKLAEGALTPAEKTAKPEPQMIPGSRSVLCPYCGKPYIIPCPEHEYKTCQNWRHLQGEINPPIQHGKPARRSSED